MIEIANANDLDNLKRQLSYTFLDAYGNFDGVDILFDCIVKTTEDRIIKLLAEHADTCIACCVKDTVLPILEGE